MRNLAQSSGVWSYVEPISLTPTWVHFDRRNWNSACPQGGYPLVRQGSKGNYVLVAQDGLNTLGYRTGRIRWHIWTTNKKCSNCISKK